MRIGIIGATGFVGGEMLRLLLRHPEAEVTVVTSRQVAGERVDSVFPALTGQTSLVFETLDPDAIAAKCDCAVMAVPHRQAMGVVPGLLDAGLTVIDYSADFRLKDPAEYERWYQAPHTAPELLARAVYGLVERHRDELQGADLVAVPGCYPNGVILGLAPLLEAELIDPATISVVGLSSITGAGASATPNSHFSAVASSVRPYGLNGHQHLPEMEAELTQAAGLPVTITFLPHVVPIERGIAFTMTAQRANGAKAEDLTATLRTTYADAPCVQVLASDQVPEPRFVRGTNRCDISARVDERTGRVIVQAALDNLVKGAAGQAVQCLNVMQGWPETAGLPMDGLWP